MVKLSMLDLIPHPDPYYPLMFEWNSQLLMHLSMLSPEGGTPGKRGAFGL